MEILYESSFFGFKQEGLKKEIDELASSIKEIDNNLGKALSFDELDRIIKGEQIHYTGAIR